MTDVASHADTATDDGRRPGHRSRRARRGLRVPEASPPVVASAGARHRRAPGTGPFVVPTGDTTTTTTTVRNRHHASDPTEAFDATALGGTSGVAGSGRHTGGHAVVGAGEHTGGQAVTRTVEPRPRHRHDPDPATTPIVTAGAEAATTTVTAATAVTAAPTTASAPTTVTATSTGRHAALPNRSDGNGSDGHRPDGHWPDEHRSDEHRSHGLPSAGSASSGALPDAGPDSAPDSAPDAGPRRRRDLPLRVTIGLVGGGGVAALFALMTPGSPLPTSAPNDPQPSVAAPAGLFGSALPSAPVAVPPSSAVPVPPAAITTTPAEDGPQPVIGALFDAAAGAFDDLFDNSANDGLVENGPRPRVVANPDDPARQAWQFSLGPGGKRSEVLPQGPGTEPTDGDEQFIRYTARLSDDFPTDTDSWQLVLQWHHALPSGSPPLALQITRGQLYMVSEGDDMQAIGPVSPGQRVDLTMRVKFSQDPDEGSVTVWRDGRPTGVTDWHPRDGTMSTPEAYMKMGMYRSTSIREGGSIIVTDLKIGRDAAGIGGIGPRRAVE